MATITEEWLTLVDGVPRWRREGRRQSDVPNGNRFPTLRCEGCQSEDVLVLSLHYEGFMNGNSEGDADFVCAHCETAGNYRWRD